MFLVENALNEVLQFSDESLKKMPFLKNDAKQLWKKEKVGEDGLFTLRSPQNQQFLTLSNQKCNSPIEDFCLDGIILNIILTLTYMPASFHQDRPKTESPIDQNNQ